MRITLNQEELFEAVSYYLRDKLQLDAAASIEISFTAGRGPKGYTADVDITYPKSELASKITAGTVQEDDAETVAPGSVQTSAEAPSVPAADAAAAGVKSSQDLFN